LDKKTIEEFAQFVKCHVKGKKAQIAYIQGVFDVLMIKNGGQA
jgi:hypothetical protein